MSINCTNEPFQIENATWYYLVFTSPDIDGTMASDLISQQSPDGWGDPGVDYMWYDAGNNYDVSSMIINHNPNCDMSNYSAQTCPNYYRFMVAGVDNPTFDSDSGYEIWDENSLDGTASEDNRLHCRDVCGNCTGGYNNTSNLYCGFLGETDCLNAIDAGLCPSWNGYTCGGDTTPVTVSVRQWDGPGNTSNNNPWWITNSNNEVVAEHGWMEGWCFTQDITVQDVESNGNILMDLWVSPGSCLDCQLNQQTCESSGYVWVHSDVWMTLNQYVSDGLAFDMYQETFNPDGDDPIPLQEMNFWTNYLNPGTYVFHFRDNNSNDGFQSLTSNVALYTGFDSACSGGTLNEHCDNIAASDDLIWNGDECYNGFCGGDCIDERDQCELNANCTWYSQQGTPEDGYGGYCLNSSSWYYDDSLENNPNFIGWNYKTFTFTIEPSEDAGAYSTFSCYDLCSAFGYCPEGVTPPQSSLLFPLGNLPWTCSESFEWEGCTNPFATNFNPFATIDDNSCMCPDGQVEQVITLLPNITQLISFGLNLDNWDIDFIFSGIHKQIGEGFIVSNGSDGYYMPNQGINTVGNINPSKGYLVHTDSEDNISLKVCGTEWEDPPEIEGRDGGSTRPLIHLNPNFMNYIGFPYHNTTMDVVVGFDNFESTLSSVSVVSEGPEAPFNNQYIPSTNEFDPQSFQLQSGRGYVVSTTSELDFQYEVGVYTYGCNDPTSCDYDNSVNLLCVDGTEGGGCTQCSSYPISPFDCNGDCCTFDNNHPSCEYHGQDYEIDCNGECGGLAEIDECGVCEGEGAAVECWDGNNACTWDECNPVECVEGEINCFNLYCAPEADGCDECISPITGDVNMDGQIDVVDIILGVNLVLDTDALPNNLEELKALYACADTNNDGEINVLDIVNMSNLVLAGLCYDTSGYNYGNPCPGGGDCEPNDCQYIYACLDDSSINDSHFCDDEYQNWTCPSEWQNQGLCYQDPMLNGQFVLCQDGELFNAESVENGYITEDNINQCDYGCGNGGGAIATFCCVDLTGTGYCDDPNPTQAPFCPGVDNNSQLCPSCDTCSPGEPCEECPEHTWIDNGSDVYGCLQMYQFTGCYEGGDVTGQPLSDLPQHCLPAINYNCVEGSTSEDECSDGVTVDDGVTCQYPPIGCMDEFAANYNSNAVGDCSGNDGGDDTNCCDYGCGSYDTHQESNKYFHICCTDEDGTTYCDIDDNGDVLPFLYVCYDGSFQTLEEVQEYWTSNGNIFDNVGYPYQGNEFNNHCNQHPPLIDPTAGNDVFGCIDDGIGLTLTNPTAGATIDDGTCVYQIDTCTDENAYNYNDGVPAGCTCGGSCANGILECIDNGSCLYYEGCTDVLATNYFCIGNPEALWYDGTYVCSNGIIRNSEWVTDDETCEYYFIICGDEASSYYGFGIPQGYECDCIVGTECSAEDLVQCEYSSDVCDDFGCTDSIAVNWNPAAIAEDGSCIYISEYNVLSETGNAKFLINEYSADSSTDDEGEAWIELWNVGILPVNLKGLFFSDDDNDPSKSKIPFDVDDIVTTIQPGDFKVIYARGDGGNIAVIENDKIFLNFVIPMSYSDESKILISERFLDPLGDSYYAAIEFINHIEDTTGGSYGRYPNGLTTWEFFSEATPGDFNRRTVELDDDYCWDYDNYTLWNIDRCDTLHTNFRLQRSGDEIELLDINGTSKDKITWGTDGDVPEPELGKSYGRCPDGYDNWVELEVPTKHDYSGCELHDTFLASIVSSGGENCGGLCDILYNNYSTPDEVESILSDISSQNVDENTFLDFFIIQELSFNGNGYENIYISIDPISGYLQLGPVEDFTYAFGGISNIPQYCLNEVYFNNKMDTSYVGWNIDSIGFSNYITQYYVDKINDNYSVGDITGTFHHNLFNRWNELRADGQILDIEIIKDRIEYYYYNIRESSEFDNNRWNFLGSDVFPGYGQYWPTGDEKHGIEFDKFETYRDTVDDLLYWIENRIIWIDRNIRKIGYQINGGTCAGDVVVPVGLHGSDVYCNDINAFNYNIDSNFNDGSCEYPFERAIVFQVDTSYVSFPPIERVQIEIDFKDDIIQYYGDILFGKNKYEMENISENVWSISFYDFDPGDVISYHFIKYVPSVYTVETGNIEQDKWRSIVISGESQVYINNYFNDFIDNFKESNLPIIKIDTTIMNDCGKTDDPDNERCGTKENPKWYCPGYLNERGVISSNEDGKECNLLKEFIIGHHNDGYFNTKEECENYVYGDGTVCSVPCADGMNIHDEPKNTAYMEIIYNGEDAINKIDDNPNLTTRVGMEVRGFSHRGFPKKQYSIELQPDEPHPQCDDVATNYNLLCNGFTPEPEVDYGNQCVFDIESDFVILGPYRDRTFVRNVLSYRLWEQMGNISSNSKYVELFINDVYMGINILLDKPSKIDKYRIPIEKSLRCFDGNCSGGFVIKIESGGEQEYLVARDGYSKMEYYDPEPKDFDIIVDGDNFIPSNEGDEMRRYIQSIIHDLEYNVYPNYNQAVVSTKIDLDNFSDYFIMQEFARNNEGYTRSQYWWTHGVDELGDSLDPNSSEKNKLYQGFVWDFNHSYGATIKEVPDWSIQTFFAVSKFWGKLFSSGGFQSQIWERWNDLRNDTFSLNNIMGNVNDISKIFLNYNSVKRDHNRWFSPDIQDYETDINMFKKYLLQRMGWVDGHICKIGDGDGKVLCDGDIAPWHCGDLYPLDSDSHGNCYFEPDYNSFIYIYNPLMDTKFSIEDSNVIKFEWVNTLDIVHYIQGSYPQYSDGDVNIDQYVVENTTLSSYDFNDGDSIEFGIYNYYTNRLVHKFVSKPNSDGSGVYEWDISDIKDIGGKYSIVASYYRYPKFGTYGYCESDRSVTYEDCGTCSDGSPYEECADGEWDDSDWIAPSSDYTLLLNQNTVKSNSVVFDIETISIDTGCTDLNAVNYDEFAVTDDGSCKYRTDCDDKYLASEFELSKLREVNITSGYNIISYPYEFSINPDLNFLDVLNYSYVADGDDEWGGFRENDVIMTHFEDKLYSATFINSEWTSISSEGYELESVLPGMGFILNVTRPGKIQWSIPKEVDNRTFDE